MTMLAPGTEHLHGIPGWDCRTCAQPWPCARAKLDLLNEFRDFPSVLTVYMSAQMHEALAEMTADGGQAPPDLYERFLAWIRHSLREPVGGETQSPTPQMKASAAVASGRARYGGRAETGKTAKRL